MADLPFKVEVKLVIISIHGVDTLNEKFTAEIYIESKWPLEYEFKDNTETTRPLATKKWRPKWKPDLEILNLISKEKCKCWYKISETDQKMFIFEMKRLKGEFYKFYRNQIYFF
jgi:hypothetical protein